MRNFFKKAFVVAFALCLTLTCVVVTGCSNKPQAKLTETMWEKAFKDREIHYGPSTPEDQRYYNRFCSGPYHFTETLSTTDGEKSRHFLVNSVTNYYSGIYRFVPASGDLDFCKVDITADDYIGAPYPLPVTPEEALNVKDVFPFAETMKGKFSLFSVNDNIATLKQENYAEFATLAEHVKTMYNLDVTPEITEIKVEFYKEKVPEVYDPNGKVKEYSIDFHFDALYFTANLPNSTVANSISLKIERCGGEGNNLDTLYWNIRRAKNFTFSSVDNAEEERYEFAENGLKIYWPTNPEENLRNAVVYHDTTANTYTLYKNVNGSWSSSPIDKDNYDTIISNAKNAILGNLLKAIEQDISMLGYNVSEQERVGVGDYKTTITLTEKANLLVDNGSSKLEFVDVKFYGNGSGWNFTGLDFTINRTVANEFVGAFDYSMVVGNVTITPPIA